MATKQITTWDEFKTALTETITENTTYEIMNDIDISDEIIKSRISIVGSYNKTINGNDHKINGITSYMTTTASQGIFMYNSNSVFFNNIHFTNIMCQNATFIYTSNSSSHIAFNSCFFNGFVYRFSCGAALNYDKCSFNFAFSPSGGLFFNASCTNCYIIGDNTQIPTTVASATNFLSSNFVDCYVGGKCVYTSGNTYLIYSLKHSVCNVEFINDSNYPKTSGNLSLTNSAATTATTVLFNRDKINTHSGVTWVDKTEIIGLTDSQLKSRSYIQQNTHFPLYG